MRKFVSLLNNRWVLGIIGILALSALVWFGADYIKFGADNHSLSLTARAIIIGAIWLIWLIWSLVTWGLEQRQNNHMVKELEAEEQNTTDPDQERSAEEIKLISDRFKQALAVLKKSRFKTGSSSKTLYQLPWYMIIGPPGAGKTTALVNSGLNFPLAESHGSGALGGIGGTRHCDWWFTNDAVLIDTAGRYTTQDSHRVVDNKAWAGFLKLLKKYRPRRPLNGVIVAISLQELMVQTADQRKHHAVTIRSRIDELQQQLSINLPIYLMFTKGDLVAGFSEFFANLSQAEREQVWGMTFPLDEGKNQPAQLFSQQYRELIQRLNQRLLWRIDAERNIDAKASIQGFPNRMDSLSTNLHDFIAHTFAANKYNESPLLRGVYFSSATQQGSPIDRMMTAVSASFGLPRSVAVPQSGSGKSFFLSRLMNNIIFAEAELVGTNRKIESLLSWGRRLGFATLALVFMSSIIVWAGTVTQNKIFMNQVSAAIDQYQQASSTTRAHGRNIVPTLSVLNPLRHASIIYDQNQSPWLSGLGLYDGRVDTAAKALYQHHLNDYFFPAFRSNMERKLSTLSATDTELPSTLGIYLMLSDQHRQDNQAITHWASEHWQQQYKGKVEQQQQLLSHLQALLAQPLTVTEPNARTLSKARQQLSRIPTSQRLYQQLQRDHLASVDLYQKIGGDSEIVFGLRPDDALFSTYFLYTRKGFNEVDYSANSDLLKKLEQDRWIYGDSDTVQYGEAERKELSKEIERAYLSDYARQWEQFLKQLNIAPFNDLGSATESLTILSDPSYSPLLTSLELTSENTQLRSPLISNATDGNALSTIVPEGLKPTVVDKEFRDIHRLIQAGKNKPAAIQDALRAIEELKEFMADINNSDNPGEASYKIAKARFNGSSNSPIQKINKLAARSPEPLQHWLEQIADHSWVVVLKETRQYISSEWNQQVYKKYVDTLANRYPLNADSDRETPLSDFNKFLSPSGIENTFFSHYLQPFIDTRKWQLRTMDGRRLELAPDALRQLSRARQLRRAYYPNGNEQMAFNFRLKPTKLDPGIKRFTLELSNTRISYSHGPQISNNASWVGGEDNRIRLLFEDLNGDMHRNNFNGDWAWLHLLDASALNKGANANNYNTTFTVGSRKAQYLLTAKTSANPFDTQLLRSYRCPQRL
ncbi:MAG: type VI secretion system membrane subunit TssM [Spongiibacteraceae bacterium]